jgi:hypothetical protein
MFRSLVVDRESADPEVAGTALKAAEAMDHRTICKCGKPKGDIYSDVRSMIEIAHRTTLSLRPISGPLDEPNT